MRTEGVSRIGLPARPRKVLVDGKNCKPDWDPASGTLLLRFTNSPEGVKVNIKY